MYRWIFNEQTPTKKLNKSSNVQVRPMYTISIKLFLSHLLSWSRTRALFNRRCIALLLIDSRTHSFKCVCLLTHQYVTSVHAYVYTYTHTYIYRNWMRKVFIDYLKSNAKIRQHQHIHYKSLPFLLWRL